MPNVAATERHKRILLTHEVININVSHGDGD